MRSYTTGRAAVLAACAAVALGGCTSTPQHSPSTAAPSIASVPASTSVTTATVTRSAPRSSIPARTSVDPDPSSAGGPAPTPECAAAFTRITAQALTPAGGNYFVLLHFTNRSARSCLTGAYPGVAVLNAAGQQVFQARRTPNGYGGGLSGSNGAPPRVVLRPGATATALLEGGSHKQPGGSSCPRFEALLVTPPNTTASRRVTAETFGCAAPVVHPVLAGTSGTAH